MTRTDAVVITKQAATCRFGDCKDDCFAGLPVCFVCALMIGKFMRDLMHLEDESPMLGPDEPAEPALRPERQAFVYYLMLTPTTVKIGTTRDLKSRIGQHGSELQYVVALELGGRELERHRHDQFPMERHGVREVFTISAALKRHIESIAPQRDDLMRLAVGEIRQPA
jgi:hypothetical protein